MRKITAMIGAGPKMAANQWMRIVGRPGRPKMGIHPYRGVLAILRNERTLNDEN
jgi:hypothetical protein